MSTRRILTIARVPIPIKRAFWQAKNPVSGQERLWRERAARMTLDALGYTNLTTKPDHHNSAVRYARAWFRGCFDNPSVDWIEVDNVLSTFDLAGILFEPVQREVLNSPVVLMEFVEIYDDHSVLENTDDGTTPPSNNCPR